MAALSRRQYANYVLIRKEGEMVTLDVVEAGRLDLTDWEGTKSTGHYKREPFTLYLSIEPHHLPSQYLWGSISLNDGL